MFGGKSSTREREMELTGHVNEDLLISYFCGDLGEERSKKLERHTANCSRCDREFHIHKMLFAGLIGMLSGSKDKPDPHALRLALRENLKENRVYYSILYPPNFVPILIACTSHGLANVIMGNFSHFEFEEKLKRSLPKFWVTDSFDETERFRRQFEAYFKHERSEFDFEIDLRLATSAFRKNVLLALRGIPYGHFVTYGELARRIGNPKATRAVGSALGCNPLPIALPCHRVVAGQGKMGGFTGGLDLKIKLLDLEGANFSASTRQMDLFNPFNSL
jgi:O-6-methylguanine DNA methyltransferase